MVHLDNLNTLLLADSYEYSMWHSSNAHKSTAAITTVNDTLFLVMIGNFI